MFKVFQIFALSVFFVGILSGEAFAQNNPDLEIQAQNIMKEADRYALSLRSSSDIKIIWDLDNKTPAYDYIENALVLTEKFSEKTKAKRFQKNVTAVISHEYGHALLHNNLMQDSKAFAKIIDKLTLLKDIGFYRVPSNIFINNQLIMSYSELFGDALAFAVTGQSNSISYAMGQIYPFEFGNQDHRRFELDESAKMNRGVQAVIDDCNTTSHFDIYKTFWKQRVLIAQFMKKHPSEGAKMIELLYQTIHEESDKWLSVPSDRLNLRSVISSFDENLRNKLNL